MPSADDEPLLVPGQPTQPQQDGVLRSYRKSKLFTVCPFILGNEFCERLAYYGVATNLPIYLTDVMKLSVGNASIQTSLFSGTCYMTPLIGAWLADGYWGRYKTIMAFSLIYAVGMLTLAASAAVPGLGPDINTKATPTSLQLGVMYFALYIVAVGTGGIKPNVSAFGADQFDDNNRQERKEKQSFFNWFYLVINVGSLVACTVIVWIQSKSWGIGFAIPAVAMVGAVVIFMSGHKCYTHIKPTGSPLERAFDLSWHAILHWLRNPCGSSQADAAAVPRPVDASPLFPDALAHARLEVPTDALAAAGAARGYNAEQVEEVRSVLRMLPVFVLTISYWTIYTQMASVFVLQAQHMNCRVSIAGKPFDIPPASMAMFDTISIIVLIPIYDGIVNPLMKRLGCELSMLQRIGWGFLVAAAAMLLSFLLHDYVTDQPRGFLVAAAAMLVAGLVETKRRMAMEVGGNVSVMTQVLQYALVGGSEVLASIGQIEFFYDQAPDVMRSVCLALNLVATALGGYFSAFLMSVVDRHTTWLNDLDDPKTSHLDQYFFLLAGFMLMNTVAFVGVASRYKYKVVKHRAPLPLVGGQQPHAVRQALTAAGAAESAVPSNAASAIDISARPGYGYQYDGTPSTPDVGPYGRSVTVMPNTPVMPPNFR